MANTFGALLHLRTKPLADCALAERVGQLCTQHAHVWGCATASAGGFSVRCGGDRIT